MLDDVSVVNKKYAVKKLKINPLSHCAWNGAAQVTGIHRGHPRALSTPRGSSRAKAVFRANVSGLRARHAFLRKRVTLSFIRLSAVAKSTDLSSWLVEYLLGLAGASHIEFPTPLLIRHALPLLAFWPYAARAQGR